MLPLRVAVVLWCEIPTLALLLTGQLSWPVVALVVALMPCVGFAGEARLGRARALSSALAVLYLVYFPVDAFFVSERLIVAVVHLLFFLKLHTLLHFPRTGDRDRLYGLCFLEMLAVAAMTVDPTFVVPFVLFVVAGAVCLLLDYGMLRTAGRETSWRSGVRSALGQGVVVLLVAGGLFLGFPRVGGGGALSLGNPPKVATMGMSNRVGLGDFGAIKKSQQIVMRVVANGVWASPPRWRGAAFDTYADGKWTQTYPGLMVFPSPHEFEFSLGADFPPRAVASEVFLEPTDLDLFFLPPGSLQLQATSRHIFVDTYQALHMSESGEAGYRYVVTWNPIAPAGATAWTPGKEIPHAPLQAYLELPPLSDAFHQLARAVAPDGAPAAAIESFLETEYRYSLVTPKRRYADPLEDFLFDARAGHCEYFATAMVLLLRARGVPARLVTGFLRGERNLVGNYELVRRSQAHAWVEVLESERGWVTYDPTPPAPEGGEEASLLSKGTDSLRMLWDKYVVNFDREQQHAFVTGVPETIDFWRSVAVLGFRELKANARLVGPAVAALALLGVLLRLWGREAASRILARLVWSVERRRLHGGRPESAIEFYGSLLARLERLGFEKPAGSTPAEYARRFEGRLPGISDLTQLYYQVRYGGRVLDRTEEANAQRLAVTVHLAALGSSKLG